MNIISTLRTLFFKLLKTLNIRPDENQKYLLLIFMITGLFGTYSSPTLTKEIISNLPAQWIAFNSLFSSICGLIFGMAWKGNFRKAALRYFAIFAIAESVCGMLLFSYLTFIHYNVWIYAIASLIYTNFISRVVCKCTMTFKSKLWSNEEREIFDNNNSIVSSIVCIIGFLFALINLPPLKFCLFVTGVIWLIDDAGWIYIYLKNRENVIE